MDESEAYELLAHEEDSPRDESPGDPRDTVTQPSPALSGLFHLRNESCKSQLP